MVFERLYGTSLCPVSTELISLEVIQPANGVQWVAAVTTINHRRVVVFLGVLLASAAVFIAVAWVTSVRLVALAPIYMFTPLAAGLVVCLTRDIPLGTVGLRLGSIHWHAAIIPVGLALIIGALFVSLAVPGVTFDPTADPIPGISLPSGLAGFAITLGIAVAAGLTLNAAFAVGEEFGWRGYLLWELAPLGYWKASMLIGTVWGLWHAPIVAAGYNYPSFPYLGIGMMTAACIAFSPVYTYLVLKAESLLAAVFLHGLFNSSAGLVLVYTTTDTSLVNELIASPIGIAGIAAFSVVAIVIAATGAPPLDRSYTTSISNNHTPSAATHSNSS